MLCRNARHWATGDPATGPLRRLRQRTVADDSRWARTAQGGAGAGPVAAAAIAWGVRQSNPATPPQSRHGECCGGRARLGASGSLRTASGMDGAGEGVLLRAHGIGGGVLRHVVRFSVSRSDFSRSPVASIPRRPAAGNARVRPLERSSPFRRHISIRHPHPACSAQALPARLHLPPVILSARLASREASLRRVAIPHGLDENRMRG